ncbi:hypothetical protein [Clostridium minihomine]|uniref:hypothetical protein n=1 Tax=Clostridium minihomine TaxID=2045012 RepID=UPI000C75D93D|nr:hypothetical protein [Clostridium minihomine]
MAIGYDGSINIDTKIDSAGFNRGVKNIGNGLDGITSSLKKLAAAAGIAFGVAAVVNFGKASVNAATELSNALLGLQSILEGQGRSFKQAQKFIDEYISDGLIPATNAITAYKNLASRGYTDPQIQDTLQALKDSAAFGRQASYSLGDAVSTATEGLKNENSILVDNAGVTKNVAKMWEDYAKSIGVSSNNLTKEQKIQAEYLGIMEETRFQVGDAAKLTGAYSGQVQQLGFNFNNLKVAVGNALIPIASAVLPGLNAIITALTRIANLFAQVTTALFGRQATQQQAVANTATNIATSSNDAAKAQSKLADATKKAGKAADGALAGFDELNVLQQDTASGNSTTDTSTPDVSSGAVIDPIGGQEIGAGVTVSPAVQTAADTIRGIFANLNKAFEPTKVALAGLWTEFERFGGFAWQGLVDFYNTFLVPVGKWVLGKGLPDFITAWKDGLAKIDYSKINSALHKVWEALTPFAINVGEGLLWFYKNVLVPINVWYSNNVVPLFLEGLAAAIEILNGIIDALKPLALWLFDNFLKPLAAWTGGIIAAVLTAIKGALQGIADFVNNHGELIRGWVVGVAAAFGLWKLIEFANYVKYIGALSQTQGLSALAATVQHLASISFAGLKTALVGAWGAMQTFASTCVGMIKTAVSLVVEIAAQTAALVKQAAQWVITTAGAAAHTVATWAQQAATVAVTAATWLFNTAMAVLTSPITLVVAAIAALIAIVYLLVTHWDQVKVAGAAAWEWIRNAWSVAGAWFNTNVVQPVSKFFSGLWSGISTAAGTAWKTVSGVWEGVSDWFQEHVITPVENGFKKSINFLIGLFEGFVNGFIDGMNVVIGLLNRISVDIPDWDIFGDMAGTTFGFSIQKMDHMSIPRLATGAVIPPRAEFAAILGDQRSGTNIEAPADLIRSIVASEIDKLNIQPQVNVIASGDNAGFVRWMKFEIEQEGHRVGPAFATGGGR